MYAGFCRIAFDSEAVDIPSVIVIFRTHTADHQLHRPDKVIQRQDVVLRSVFIVFNVAKGTTIKGNVTARLIAPFHVVNTGTGTGKEHHIGVDPVNIKVIAIKTLTGPDRGVIECAAEGGKLPELDKRLTQVEIAAGGGPVVVGALSIGQHRFETGGRAVVQRLFMFEVELNVGIRFITKATNVTAGFPGRGHSRATLSFGGRAVHQQS